MKRLGEGDIDVGKLLVGNWQLFSFNIDLFKLSRKMILETPVF